MPDPTDPAVVLRPPLEVMRPRPVDAIPRETGLPGDVQYSIKLDGIRITHAAEAVLRPGTVLEGER